MNLSTTVDPGLAVRLSAVLPHVSSWKAVVVLLGVLVIGWVGRLLAEWQRRKTLVAVIKEAKNRTVIEQHRGRHGPALRIEIDSDLAGPRAPKSTP